ncbi:argonaute-like protein (AGO1) [Leptomonas seymouri]|uniref:Argonaute-like protein (AGO1) n=1 Tax=Leptomonas seymouri TaxID=5684 RepID=A0A0N1PAN1_LEPSE|nr:argonaute-like protein (AGO1) [Leptomonas seymouri]|eukprot:KPI85008.1 argonaute-like protein (AGO1) [Leptomonas seymouri]
MRGGGRWGRCCGGSDNMRECQHLTESAESLFVSKLTMYTNCFPVDITRGTIHSYVTSFEFLENGKAMAGDGGKTDFQRELLRAIPKPCRCSSAALPR